MIIFNHYLNNSYLEVVKINFYRIFINEFINSYVKIIHLYISFDFNKN